MAATRLIALHVNKGKTVAQCLADRTDYSQNAAKTNDGEYNLVKKKVFHSVRIGGSIRISKKSFDEWLDHQM